MQKIFQCKTIHNIQILILLKLIKKMQLIINKECHDKD